MELRPSFPGSGIGRRGVALPVALVALLAVSLLVTTVVLTGATEHAISGAHRSATASLFDADASLEQFIANGVAQGGVFMAATQPGAPASIVGPDGATYDVDVARLLWQPSTNTDPMTATEVFSLIVQPQNARGRSVGALVRLERSVSRFNVSLNAGATSGGDLKVSGNATISDGRSGTNYCGAADNQSDFAVQVTAGSTISQGGNSTFEGQADTADFTKEQMSDVLLGGRTLDEIAEEAEIKFGTRWSQPAFSTTTINSDPSTPDNYNWGCPQPLIGTDFTCPEGSTDRQRVVAIDAGGGTVKINGRYGQGMLIVVNGSLEIQGNFIYKGIILVEKDVNIRGGAAGSESKIEGGIVAFGQSSTVEDNITGTATIKYNICAINDALSGMNESALLTAPQVTDGGTFAWFELIR